jgi:hypothetical protein
MFPRKSINQNRLVIKGLEGRSSHPSLIFPLDSQVESLEFNAAFPLLVAVPLSLLSKMSMKRKLSVEFDDEVAYSVGLLYIAIHKRAELTVAVCSC